MRKKNFTLVEIMIVVAIIGLLAAIAIPSFVKARNVSRANSCINNLRLIDAGKEQWALETDANDGDVVDEVGVNEYLKSGAPGCPSAGLYVYNPIGTDPTCDSTSLPAHALP